MERGLLRDLHSASAGVALQAQAVLLLCKVGTAVVHACQD